MYLKAEDRFVELPAVQVGTVVNTVGAGDALFSSFLHFNAKGYEATKALYLAQVFAAHKIMSNGGANGFVTEDVITNWTNDK